MTADPSFTTLKLGPVPGAHPGRNGKGICKAG
jgi:hypothetical protein